MKVMVKSIFIFITLLTENTNHHLNVPIMSDSLLFQTVIHTPFYLISLYLFLFIYFFYKRRFFSEYAASQRVSHHRCCVHGIYKRFFLPQRILYLELRSFKRKPRECLNVELHHSLIYIFWASPLRRRH